MSEMRQGGGTMGKRLGTVTASVAVLAVLTVGIALAQTGPGAAHAPVAKIHVVYGPQSHAQFFDFDGDGLGFGDRLTAVGPLFDQDQTKQVGTAYIDCSIVSPVLEGGTYDCTYVLQFKDGAVTTQGIDPQGPSDVTFAVTGGTGAYRGATGQAENIDTDVTDIIISLN
jgi:hypothetical protein